MSRADTGFLSRWSQRKVRARQGAPHDDPAQPPAPAPLTTPPVAPDVTTTVVSPSVDATQNPTAPKLEAPPAATMADVAALTRESDFSRFVARGVDGDVRNAALKKLFGDPRFNVMDGLDTYIDDYTKPDPLPLSSVRKMAQAVFLGLAQPEPSAPPASTAAEAPPSTDATDAIPDGVTAPSEPNEDADLRLQSHDAAGCGGAEDGAAADPWRQP